MCDVRKCDQPRAIRYYNRGVCADHWIAHCSDTDSFNLKIEFELPMNELEIQAHQRSIQNERSRGISNLKQFSSGKQGILRRETDVFAEG